MAEEDDASKTEDPSAKKLSDARRKGQVAQSQEVKNWVVLLGGTGALIFLAPFMANSLRKLLFPFMEQPHAIDMDFTNLHRVFADMATDVGWIMAPVFLLLFVLAIAANVGQFGLILSGEKVKPDPTKISVIKGLGRMFSIRSTMEFIKGILKLLAVSTISLAMVIPVLGDLAIIPRIDFIHSLDRIHELAILIAAGTVGVMTIIAAIDFVFHKYKFTKDMRMTRQEVRDEQKQSEGDPQIKARIRKIRGERARQRMMAAVSEADVVVTNPTHYSVALAYKMEEMPAPKVVAKGVDHLAFRIREIAEANDVPLVENPPLARALYALVEIDEEIPPEHFKAVAEVIGYVMRLRGDLPQ